MSAPRAVRIARRRDSPGATAPDSGAIDDVLERPNVAGSARGWRLFAVFVVLLVVIYASFLAVAARAAGGLAAAPAAPATFSLIALALGAWGWSITLGRAPRSVTVRSDATLVLERTGRTRRFSAEPSPTFDIVERYAAGWLSPEPTQLVRIAAPRGRARLYLVGRALFDGAPLRGR